jgi:hypothetical protein
MKMTLDMTFEDGKKVLDALRECAVSNGWEKDELDESGIMEEYTAVVDAALTAMGISVNISHEPEDADENKYCNSAADCYFCNSEDEEDEEVDTFGVPTDYWSDNDEEEEDEEEDTCQYTLTPVGEFVARALAAGIAFEDAVNLAKIVFDNDEGE